MIEQKGKLKETPEEPEFLIIYKRLESIRSRFNEAKLRLRSINSRVYGSYEPDKEESIEPDNSSVLSMYRYLIEDYTKCIEDVNCEIDKIACLF